MSRDQLEKQLVKIGDVVVTEFNTREAWMAYMGDPNQKPDWFTYLINEIKKAPSKVEAEKAVEAHKSKLKSAEEREEVERQQIEKGIEDLYWASPLLLGEGKLTKVGRQHPTETGPIDMLFKDQDGMYVVVEIKVGEAGDSVWGQILRYIGWVHRNLPDGENNVRGIILASGFPTKAELARIGLMRKDHKKFIKFVSHGIKLPDQ